MRLLARRTEDDYTEQIYLSRPELVQKYLDDGWDVYQINDTGKEEPVTDPAKLPSNSNKSKTAATDDVAAAFNILVYGEEAEHGDTDAGA